MNQQLVRNNFDFFKILLDLNLNSMYFCSRLESERLFLIIMANKIEDKF